MTLDIARRRLINQGLLAPTLRTAKDVVRFLGAVQSQDYPNAKWAIARRTPGLTDAAIEREFASGAILRTHVLRPTWHFVLPEDARWMLDLTASRVSQAMSSNNRKLELDANVFWKSNAAIERALRDGQHLTRAELKPTLERARIDVSSMQRLAHIVLQAELDRVVISGGPRGGKLTYALFDLRVAPSPARVRDDALGELARRYFTTRGPATLHDFAWWSGLTVADAKRGVEVNGKELMRETIDDRQYWSAPSADGRSRWRRLALLLPNYDELFVGFKDRGAFGQRLRLEDTGARVDALMGHTLFVDGQIIGGWRRAARRGDVEVDVLVSLTDTEQRLVQRELAGFRAFVGAAEPTGSGTKRGRAW
jgi:hypothetical protein